MELQLEFNSDNFFYQNITLGLEEEDLNEGIFIRIKDTEVDRDYNKIDESMVSFRLPPHEAEFLANRLQDFIEYYRSLEGAEGAK